MPSTPIVACRLFVILAREAPVGVIFRRGPSEWTKIIKWNTDSDTFEFGTSFHGKIFHERSDISPDGSKLIYFATKYSNLHREFPTAWTALSKVPWLTALCTWPNLDTHYGGGLFESNTKAWINQDIWSQGGVTDGSALPRNFEVSYENPLWDHDWHNLSRLERSGWKPIEEYPWGSVPALRLQSDGTRAWEPTNPDCPMNTPAYIRTVHEKPIAGGEFILIITSIFHHYQPNTQTFELRNNHQKTTISIEGAVWVDWDKRGRLVYAKQGKLFAVDTADIGRSGEIRSKELAEFNSLKPKRVKSPDWAREW